MSDRLRFFVLHALVLLSVLALWGWIETDNRYLILCAALSFYGALCFAFIGLYRKKRSAD